MPQRFAHAENSGCIESLMLPLYLIIVVFVTVVMAVFAFGAAAVTPSSVLGARLRALGGQQQPVENKPAFRERMEQALDPAQQGHSAFSRRCFPHPRLADSGRLPRCHRRQLLFRRPRSDGGCRLCRRRVCFPALTTFSCSSGIPGLGFFLPRFILKRMIKDRQHRIRLGLPDALDLTVICVEAGLALDQALMRVGQDLHHAHPDLSDEFHLVNLEMRAGKPRAEALRNLVDRTGVDDIRSLVGTLIQTDRFGTSVAQALRVHSDSLRTERRQRAEEQAAKTTIKMVPPLVIFVLPSIIFVTIGPAVIELIRQLGPVSGGK